jgi:hypothetical protein
MGPTGCLGGPGPAGAGAAYRGTQGHTKVADQDGPSRLVGRSLCKQCFPDSLCKALSTRYRKMNALKQPADEKTLLPPSSAALGLSHSDTGLAIETGYV